MITKEGFKTIIENINEAILGVDNEGKIFIVNKAAEELLKINKEDLYKYIEKVIPYKKIVRIMESDVSELNEKIIFNEREFIVNKFIIDFQENFKETILIFRDETMYRTMEKEINKYKFNIDILNTVINTVNDWIVVVDEKGIITMMSKAYKDFVNCSDPEGKSVLDVIENTRLHKVIESGNMEVGDLQEIRSNKMVSMRIPIKKDGKVVGAIGKVMFKDINDFFSLSKKLSNLQKEVEFYKDQLSKERKAKYSFDDIIGNCNKIQQVKAISKRAANTNSNVLIIGESGTGKELYAHAIHNASKRYLGPFVKLNCAAIPSELLEAELFGYEEGAFTGAKKGGKKGKFELANKGTIFLDEIGDMPINMQVKLLRVLQEKEIERVGGNVLKEIDVRIIAATNKNLENMIKEEKFREDLYYRLNVMKVVLPPLRERKEDIPLIANALRMKVADKLGMYVEGISKKAIECLVNYNWTGNIRELENVIERAINLLDSDLVIKPKHLPERLSKNKIRVNIINEGKYLKDIVEEVEREVILEYLKKTNWNKNKTAKLLGISRAGLYRKIEEFNLEAVQKVYM
ncbi:sigma 54-interacting transcriptional regulator [Clostridium sp. OS1-26]|uniref:sigma 54-interacting transcriptional regulator n=1 Tax=Clostridium sp. OS1-26 TaxID=3070681 RepID=UPI0027E0AE1A|nr:sigma 54-interacting transcriptional regulator [Clostridium sp. OS1-26]WML37721.1 sigma 54-interacting transcriptional regulator [Clostridium sp. OS1-26]